MMIRNVDVDGGPYLIDHVSARLVAREATLTIGRRDNRLSRWMARQEMKARPKAKKRRQK